MSTAPETIRLFDQDGYATDFEAVVLSCEKTKENLFQVVLDQTLFFPEEGGQSPDKGQINGIEVVDVQIDVYRVITHTLREPLEVCRVVSGSIDWKHRFNNMQQHSGEHLFSGLVYSLYGYRNVGFHLSDQVVTMDFDGMLSGQDIEDVEWRVNEAVAKNIGVEITYPNEEELKHLSYRSKMEIEGQVRIVTIPGYDVCACCAPHVHSTGEIGMLKVMGTQNYKGGVRISILCGFRALEAFREKSEVITALMGLLTTGQESLFESVRKLKAGNQLMSSRLNSAKQEILLLKLERLPQEQRNVFVFEPELDLHAVRMVVNRMVEIHGGVCGIFSGTDEYGYNYILAGGSVDCREIAAQMKEAFAAKGGGGAEMIQGSVKAPKEQIQSFLEKICQ